jgi:hypothetical protein
MGFGCHENLMQERWNTKVIVMVVNHRTEKDFFFFMVVPYSTLSNVKESNHILEFSYAARCIGKRKESRIQPGRE